MIEPGSANNGHRLPSPERKLALAVFIALLGLHTFCLGRQLGYTEDALPILRHTETVIEFQSFTHPITPDGDYSMYGIGMTLWYLPIRLLAGAAIPDSVDPYITAFYLRVAYIYLNALATAGTAAILCVWGLGFGYSRKSSVLGAFCFSLATIAFPYARFDFSEPVTGFFVVGGIFFLWRYRRDGDWKSLILSGTFLACGALTRIVVGLAILPLLAFVAVSLKPKSKVRDPILFSVPLMTALAIVLGYNYGRFGNALETGYPIDFETPLMTGVFGLLLSWGRGLLIYSPVSVLGLIALFLSKRIDGWSKGVIGYLFIFFLVLHAKWSYWYGGWCWGPRLLLPVLAFAGLGLIEVFRWENQRRIWITLLYGVGGLINLIAVFTPFTFYYQSILSKGFQEEWLLWRRRYCPLKIQHELLTQVWIEDYDYIWLGWAEWNWPVVAIGAAGAALAIHGIWRVYWLGWKPEKEEPFRLLVPNDPVE